MLQFLRGFNRVARQVVTTSLVSAFVGWAFTSLMTGKYVLAQMGGYPAWSRSELPAAFILLLMLTCYLVFLWMATDTTVQVLEDNGHTYQVEVLGRGGLVVRRYWSRAKWKMVVLILSPMTFCAPAGAFLYLPFQEWQWPVGIPLFVGGWLVWWYGWWRLFRGAARQPITHQPGLVVHEGGNQVTRRR